MSWRVISSVICPNTGIVYSSILGLKFLKLIIGMKAMSICTPVTGYIRQKWRLHKWCFQAYIDIQHITLQRNVVE